MLDVERLWDWFILTLATLLAGEGNCPSLQPQRSLTASIATGTLTGALGALRFTHRTAA